jgi:PAS domain-containing protein
MSVMPSEAKKSKEQKAAESEVDGFRKDLGPFVVAAETTRMAMVFTDAKEASRPLIFANDSFLFLTGYDREEVLGQSFDFLMARPTDPEALAKAEVAFAGKAESDFEISFRRKARQSRETSRGGLAARGPGASRLLISGLSCSRTRWPSSCPRPVGKPRNRPGRSHRTWPTRLAALRAISPVRDAKWPPWPPIRRSPHSPESAKSVVSEPENMGRRNPIGVLAGALVVGVLIGLLGRRRS